MRSYHALLVVSAASSALAQNLLVNGGFEDPAGLPFAPDGVATLSEGADFPGWRILGLDEGEFDAIQQVVEAADGVTNSIDVLLDIDGDPEGLFWEASEGVRSVDLAGDDRGAIAQAFDTTPGADYDVSFDLAGDFLGGPAIKSAFVLVRDTATGAPLFEGAFDFDDSASTRFDMGWVRESLMFEAMGAETELIFVAATDASSSWGPALDNVSVTLVPAPGALACGSVALAIGRRRRR